jgi:hypothetical protein
MTPDPASLDRLHDLVLPPAVPWWPPAPGWYGVLFLLAFGVAWLAWRFWKRWRANGYRRAARRALTAAQSAPAIAELLRRTALAMAPRPVIAEMSGGAWLDWLSAQCPTPMPDGVRRLLTAGIYGRPAADPDLGVLRDYTARWIARHRAISPEARRPE